ncbi:MAG: (Fe-S)-binding protein, partial [Acidobacteria bacterium]|nr:(Fe-S)-binding protein [Acidobacteriota bacterium]
YTTIQFVKGLGIADVTGDRWFRLYALAVAPFAVAVLLGIAALLVRRVWIRPPALGETVSVESVVIGLFIASLMITFLLDFRLAEGPAARLNWWAHALIVLVFLSLIPGSKHLHLLLSPVTVLLESPSLGALRNLDFEREEVGLETVSDLERKHVLDAFTCVECGRCQDHCPAHGTGKRLNPKRLILQNEDALLAGRRDAPLGTVYDTGVLWQCTTCGACEYQCPVGIEHLSLIVGARRGQVSNGDAPAFLVSMFNNLERRGNIWGFTPDQRQRFVVSAGLETFDATRHEYLLWLGCAGSFDADFQRSLRSLSGILRARGVTFGVLARERCTGDPARRTGNEYLYQELGRQNVEDFNAAGVRRILTACPHCLKTLGDDYREFGFRADVTHAAVTVASLMGDVRLDGAGTVALHDPCYLARYAGCTAEPRDLLRRVGATLAEPDRHGARGFCCGAGGGLLFEEHEAGKRISQERLEQLQATGASTIITNCPFCAIMLKGAQASANTGAPIVDLMTYVDERMKAASMPGGVPTRPPAPS